jgi:lipoprotein signal peptidase
MASAVDRAAPGEARRMFVLAAAATVVLDLVTKVIAETTLLRTPGVSVFGDWFQLRLVYNQGAAFGLHVGP